MEEIKYVISELNKAPFNKKLNVISYDSLRDDQRMELLFQIFKQIDETVNVESFQVADIEEVIVKILETLRIFKYEPPEGMNPSTFRENLILGEKTTYTHIFSYLLRKLPELKKRAYLARYLVKIAVSPDVEGDNDIVQLYNQYDQLIENFKTVHITYENLINTLESVQEVQKDIKAMEEEKEQVIDKLNNVKRKVDANQNPQLFNLVQVYKEEKDKNEKMLRQKIQQENETQNLTKQINRWAIRVKEAQSAHQSASTPEELFEKLEEEIQTKEQLIREILPQELELLKRQVEDLNEISAQPSLGPQYLDRVNQKIQALNQEIQSLMEKRMLNNELMDEKLQLFRQNASTVAKKRAATQSKCNEISGELMKLRASLRERRGSVGEEVALRGDSLKQYIATLRNKGSVYKQKRQELAELRTEVGIHARTEEILKQKDTELTEILSSLEDKKGISGYFTGKQDEDGLGYGGLGSEQESEQSLEQLAEMIQDLNARINEKKTKLAPSIKDLRPMRQRCQELQQQFDKKKAAYDSCAIGLESGADKLEQELKKMKERVENLESSNYNLEAEIEVLEAKEEIIKEEMKYFVSNSTEDKEKSFTEKLQKEIKTEKEKEAILESKKKLLKENEEENRRQTKLWKDLEAIFELKNQILIRKAENNKPSSERRDHLIL